MYLETLRKLKQISRITINCVRFMDLLSSCEKNNGKTYDVCSVSVASDDIISSITYQTYQKKNYLLRR